MRKPTGLLYDEIDAELVESMNWSLTDSGYAINRRTSKRLHRLIMNPPPGFEVDHCNGDKLDNRRENLRVVRHIENTRNLQKPRSNNQSGHRGVIWSKRDGCWRAQAKVDGRNRFLGHFSEVEEAARVAREWRLANMPGALS